MVEMPTEVFKGVGCYQVAYFCGKQVILHKAVIQTGILERLVREQQRVCRVPLVFQYVSSKFGNALVRLHRSRIQDNKRLAANSSKQALTANVLETVGLL